MQPHRPEGAFTGPPGKEALRKGMTTGEIFGGMCVKCDEFHNLHVDLGEVKGLIPREEAALGIAQGQTKEIAILSRVGKPVCFRVLTFDSRGIAILSRSAAQLAARERLLSTLQPGDVIPAMVQTPQNFGVFCDIGWGFAALMPIDRCCVSRLQSTAQRYKPGQALYAAVLGVDREAGLITLTGRETLGTWEENASQFRPGQTVTGVVRSIMGYGIFIELTPNLSGLAECQQGLEVGDRVSVYIRSVQPMRHKIKLTVLEKLTGPAPNAQDTFYITSGHIDRWEYYPGSTAFTVF